MLGKRAGPGSVKKKAKNCVINIKARIFSTNVKRVISTYTAYTILDLSDQPSYQGQLIEE